MIVTRNLRKLTNQNAKGFSGFSIVIILSTLITSSIGCSRIEDKQEAYDGLLKLSSIDCKLNESEGIFMMSDSEQHFYRQAKEKQLSQSPDRRPLDLKANRDVYTSKQLNNIRKYYFGQHHYHESDNKTIINIGELVRWTVEANYHAHSFNDLMIHRYSDLNELQASGGPQANQRKCIRLLEDLVARAEILTERDKFKSNDTNLYQLLDTFGRVPAGLLRGKVVWTGSYEECLRVKIMPWYRGDYDKSAHNQTHASDTEQEMTRYCLAKVKLRDWSKGSSERGIFEEELLTLSCAVCLPRACDSQEFENKLELVERLLEFQSRRVDQDQFQVTSLYCPPDFESPQRSFFNSRPAVISLIALSSWIVFVLYISFANKEKDSNFLKFLKSTCDLNTNLGNLLKLNQRNDKKKVNLNVIEGIKVIAMLHIISLHLSMLLGQIEENTRDVARSLNLVHALSIITPAISVNIFFFITGMLNSYLTLKTVTDQLLANILDWLRMIPKRYLRIMPVYLLVLIYNKNLAKFAGSGPFWDHGTSSLSVRRICHEEPWWLSLLMLSSLRAPTRVCVTVGWYLANDFQFLLITPILLLLIKLIGKSFKGFMWLIIVMISYETSRRIYTSPNVSDFRSMLLFTPEAIQMQMDCLADVYSHFPLRIPPYLIGLMIGYDLSCFEKRRETSSLKRNEATAWNRIRNKLTMALILLTLLLRYWLRYIPFTKEWARFAVSVAIPSSYVVFALGIGAYIKQVATTPVGHSGPLDRFLGSSFWKPFSKLNLCVMLVHFDLIQYIVQSSRRSLFLDTWSLSSMWIIALPLSYLLALFVYLFFEAPIAAVVERTIFKKRINIRPGDKKVI